MRKCKAFSLTFQGPHRLALTATSPWSLHILSPSSPQSTGLCSTRSLSTLQTHPKFTQSLPSAQPVLRPGSQSPIQTPSFLQGACTRPLFAAVFPPHLPRWLLHLCSSSYLALFVWSYLCTSLISVRRNFQNQPWLFHLG